MKLRYKGEDGSMKLKTDHIYECEIKTIRNYICVKVHDPELGVWICPYGSPGTLAHYWKLP